MKAPTSRFLLIGFGAVGQGLVPLLVQALCTKLWPPCRSLKGATQSSARAMKAKQLPIKPMLELIQKYNDTVTYLFVRFLMNRIFRYTLIAHLTTANLIANAMVPASPEQILCTASHLFTGTVSTLQIQSDACAGPGTSDCSCSGIGTVDVVSLLAHRTRTNGYRQDLIPVSGKSLVMPLSWIVRRHYQKGWHKLTCKTTRSEVLGKTFMFSVDLYPDSKQSTDSPGVYDSLWIRRRENLEELEWARATVIWANVNNQSCMNYIR